MVNWCVHRECFCEELGQPQGDQEELVAMLLLSMVTRFCNSSAPHFPIRKVLLLLWKVLLTSLGGTQILSRLKSEWFNQCSSVLKGHLV